MSDTPTPRDRFADLLERFHEWCDAVPTETDLEGDGPGGDLVLTSHTSGDSSTIKLSPHRLLALQRALLFDAARINLAQEREVRNEKMVAVIVAASAAEEDIGELLACALNQTAKALFQPWYLIADRPGSWEASIVMDLASQGEWLTPTNPHRVKELTDLLISMGEQREDGGDTISWVLGKAVDRRGGMGELLGHSRYRGVLENLGGQYATVSDRGMWSAGGAG
jgi:hypothetical protein